MQYIPSNKLYRVIGIERRKELAKQLMEVFLRQVIEHGCIHADPHPGNIGITKEGQLVLYDFGQVSTLDTELSTNLRTLLFSVYDRDINYITEMLIKSKAIILVNPNVDRKSIKKLVGQVLKYFQTVDFNEFQLSMLENNEFGFELPFKVNPKLIMVFRSLSILEGMCKELDPSFSYFDVINEIISDVFFDMDYIGHRARKDFIKMFDDVSTQPHLDVLQENIEKNNKTMTRNMDKSLQDYKILMVSTMCISLLDAELLHIPKVVIISILIAVVALRK
jgi:predicted unusual protein kinase regulating ubiquinone biosynthesis (AarF/ABC1/UbiB family)